MKLATLTCAALAAASAVYFPAGGKGQTKMDEDPFFNKITLELIEPPPAVREAFAASLRDPQWAPVPQSEFALQQAKSWLISLLRPEYAPPPETAFITLPLENAVCDTIRAQYRRGAVDIDAAQSRYVIAITVKGLQHPGNDLEKAQNAARQIFAKRDRIRLEWRGTRKGGSYGQQGGPLFDPEWAYWVDSMRWWSDSETVGFVLLRAPGGPNRIYFTPEEVDNRRWFGRYPI
jgi:hypothetical protein